MSDKTSCSLCLWHEGKARGAHDQGETFQYMGNALTFDVERAKEIIRERPRDALFIPDTFLANALTLTQINSEHVQHVNGDEPGIVASITLAATGSRGACLIDGHHRGQQKVDAGEKYKAYPLTEEETFEIVTDNTGLNLLAPPEKAARPRRARSARSPSPCQRKHQ